MWHSGCFYLPTFNWTTQTTLFVYLLLSLLFHGIPLRRFFNLFFFQSCRDFSESLLIVGASSMCKSVLIEGCFQYYCLMVWRYGNRSGVRARLSCELVELGSSAAPTRPWDGPTQRDKKTPLGHRSCCARVAPPDTDARNTITTSDCNVTSIRIKYTSCSILILKYTVRSSRSA